MGGATLASQCREYAHRTNRLMSPLPLPSQQPSSSLPPPPHSPAPLLSAQSSQQPLPSPLPLPSPSLQLSPLYHRRRCHHRLRCCCCHYHHCCHRRRKEQHNTKCQAIERMTMADVAVEVMRRLHTYPLKQRRCCLMDCPLSDSATRGRSAGRLCQLEGFEPTMTLVPEQSNSL